MNNLTREEMATFRTALALVVVKNRLQHKQQQQQQQAGPHDHDRKRGNAKDPNPVVGKRTKTRTMDSLLFPWMDHHHDDDDEAESDAHPHSSSVNTSPARLQLQQAQAKQREHLQSILTTALATASGLVPATLVEQPPQDTRRSPHPTKANHRADAAIVSPVPQEEEEAAAWSTLEALTRHMAQQMAFALQMATTSPWHEDPASPTPPPALSEQPCWIAEWVRDHLLQLLLGGTEQPSDHGCSTRCMDAAFLVWHGILGFATSSTSSSECPTSRAPCYAACRRLFLRILGDLLQELGIVRGLPSRLSPPPSAATLLNRPSTGLQEQPLAGAEEQSCKTSSYEGGTVDSELFHRNANISLTMTMTSDKHAAKKKGASKKADWQRLFEMKSYRYPPGAAAGRFKNGAPGGGGGGGNHEAASLVDPWLVHCLQLLQKLVQADNKADSSTISEGCGRPGLSSYPWLHPESLLPPTDLVAWYVQTAADGLGTVPPRPRQQGPFPNNKSAATGSCKETTPANTRMIVGATHARVDPGAQLMTMITLYQALMMGE